MNGPFMDGALASIGIRRLFNFLFLPSTPFSLAAFIGLDSWGPRGWWHAVALHAVTWAFWLGILAGLVRWWRRVRAPQLTSPAEPPHASRRRFLADTLFGSAGVAGAAGWGISTARSPWSFDVGRYRVALRDLPPGLDGLRLVQISDTHLGPRIPADYIRRVVEAALAEQPDVFVLSGDYVHNGPMYIGPAAELFRPLTATGRPVVGTLGNHDWYAGGPAMSRALAEAGVRMLDNRRTFLDARTRRLVDSPDQPQGVLCIAGLGDLKTDTLDPHAALEGVPQHIPRLVISHNPDSAERTNVAQGPRIDLMLSGHFHGGQIQLPFLGNPFMKGENGDKYLSGIVHGPAFPVLVSRGLGMSVLPIRINCTPELVVLTLTSSR